MSNGVVEKKKNQKQASDFDPNALASSVQEHAEGISNLSDRVDLLEHVLLENAESFSKAFETHTKDSKKMDILLASIFCEMIAKNEDVKDKLRFFFKALLVSDNDTKHLLKNEVDKMDRDAKALFWKKFGSLSWMILGAVLLATFSAVAGALAAKYLGSAGSSSGV